MRAIWLICRKDLQIEMRSRVVLLQIVPFAVLIMILFAFAFDADRPSLRDYASGLYWVTVLLVSILFILRSFGFEVENGATDNLRLSPVKPAFIFFGKALALFIGLALLQIIMGIFAVLLYDITIENYPLLIIAGVLGGAGLASAATLYGILSASLKSRETILPLLLLPVLLPVFLGAIRSFDDALGSATSNGWAWLSMLGAFAFIYTLLGSMVFGPLLREVDTV